MWEQRKVRGESLVKTKRSPDVTRGGRAPRVRGRENCMKIAFPDTELRHLSSDTRTCCHTSHTLRPYGIVKAVAGNRTVRMLRCDNDGRGGDGDLVPLLAAGALERDVS